MSIRELSARPQYLDRIIDWHRSEWPRPGMSREAVRARLYGTGAPDRLPVTLVLEEDGELSGYATLILYEQGRAEGRLHWIDAVYVDPARRRRGLGSRLISAAEKKAISLGIDRLFVLTDLAGLYLKLGWEPADEANRGKSSDVVLAKTLRQR